MKPREGKEEENFLLIAKKGEHVGMSSSYISFNYQRYLLDIIFWLRKISLRNFIALSRI
jgi:hypothetical protein